MHILLAISIIALIALLWSAFSIARHVRRVRRRRRRASSINAQVENHFRSTFGDIPAAPAAQGLSFVELTPYAEASVSPVEFPVPTAEPELVLPLALLPDDAVLAMDAAVPLAFVDDEGDKPPGEPLLPPASAYSEPPPPIATKQQEAPAPEPLLQAVEPAVELRDEPAIAAKVDAPVKHEQPRKAAFWPFASASKTAVPRPAPAPAERKGFGDYMPAWEPRIAASSSEPEQATATPEAVLPVASAEPTAGPLPVMLAPEPESGSEPEPELPQVEEVSAPPIAAETPATKAFPGFPSASRPALTPHPQSRVSRVHERPDWAYFNKDMGDLTDPEAARAKPKDRASN